LDQVSPELLIASIAALAAVGSAAWSYYSCRTARSALAIAEKERAAKDGRVDVYIVNVYAVSVGNDHRVVADLVLTNASEIPDALVRIELLVEYVVDDHRVRAVVSPTRELPKLKAIPARGVDSPPLSIDARGSKAVLFCFKLPERIAASGRIMDYSVEASFASGAESCLSPVLVKIVHDA
jgi:hypothetical protein